MSAEVLPFAKVSRSVKETPIIPSGSEIQIKTYQILLELHKQLEILILCLNQIGMKDEAYNIAVALRHVKYAGGRMLRAMGYQTPPTDPLGAA